MKSFTLSRIFVPVIFLAIMTQLLTACSSEAREEEQRQEEEARILADVDSTLRGVLSSGETIDSIEILSRETDEESGVDNIKCQVSSNNGELAFIKYFDVQFRPFEEQGWVLDYANPDRQDMWAVAPMVGAKPEVIENALLEASIRVDDEEWGLPNNDIAEPSQNATMLDFAEILGSIFGLSPGSSNSNDVVDPKATIENVAIINQNTQLESKRDSVTVAVTLNSDVLIAEGEMEVNLVFNDDTTSWETTDYRVSAPFTSSYKEGRELTISNDELISAIDRKTFMFSSSLSQSEQDRLAEEATIAILGKLVGFPIGTLLGQSGTNDGQEITIRADEISNFTIAETSVAAKGSFNAYTCEFTLDKGIIQFSMVAVIAYQHDSVNGWAFKDVTFISRVESYNPELMIGLWTGQATSQGATNSSKTQMILDIAEIAEDGAVTATAEFPALQYSHTFSGWFNHNDFTISFIFDEWIEHHERRPQDREYNMTGYLRVDDNMIKEVRYSGNEYDSFKPKTRGWFELTKQD